VVQNLIHNTLGKNPQATLAMFDIIKNQSGY